MYVTQTFRIQGSFVESAREAIRKAYEKNGYPPREVMVQSGTDLGGNTFITVSLGQEIHNIPLRERDDLKIGWDLADDEAVLDVCNPHSPLE